MTQQKNIFHQSFFLNRDLFQKSYQHKSKVIWFTGLSGSGKSSLANEVSRILFECNIKVFVLDGDITRLGLNKDLGFSLLDRKENIRRVSEVAKLFVESGTVVLTSFISPIAQDRLVAKQIIGEEDFIEVFIDCPLEICEKRDVKGLYAKARKGEIKNFTGIDSPYEIPLNPDITINTAEKSISECANIIVDTIKMRIKE
jgi:adenylylsulfate kinase